MEAKLIAMLLLLPITVIIIVASIREYQRFKSEGRANYGLAYDEKTGTTYVTGISAGEDAFDPNDFDPSNYDEQRDRKETDDDRA